MRTRTFEGSRRRVYPQCDESGLHARVSWAEIHFSHRTAPANSQVRARSQRRSPRPAAQSQRLGGLLVLEPGEVAQLDQGGACGSCCSSFGRAPRRQPTVRPPGRLGATRPSTSSCRWAPPPRFCTPLAPRARSTRMRHMASAAAAKKWPRLFQCRSDADRPAADRLRGPGRWPEGSGRASRGQPLHGQPAQLVVDQRQQLLGGLRDRPARSPTG